MGTQAGGTSSAITAEIEEELVATDPSYGYSKSDENMAPQLQTQPMFL